MSRPVAIAPRFPPLHNFSFMGGGGAGAAVCAGFIFDVDPSTGVITMTESGAAYAGDDDSGYAEPTWVQTGNVLSGSGGVVPASGTYYVWTKFSYDAIDASEFGTAWKRTNTEFDFGATQPDNTMMTYNWSTENWSGTGAHYSPWGKIVDRVKIWSYGGGMMIRMCDPDNIYIEHGCQQ